MNRARKVAFTLVVVALVGTACGYSTFSAFSSSRGNAGNSFTAGTVAISDNDSSAAVVTLSGVRPNSSAGGCMLVTYTGSLASTVRMYGSSSGSLAQYLTLTVTRGSDTAPSFPSCTNFTSAAEPDYIGQGAGVVYSGPLQSLPATFAAAHADPTAASPATWAHNDAHAYKFTVTLPSSAPAAAQGLSATATFTWEARNQ